jgi:polysaccharide biosynthesis protein PslH
VGARDQLAAPDFLWITDEASTAPRTGGAIRSHRLLSALAREATVDVVSMGPVDVGELAAQTGARQVVVIELPRHSRLTAKAIGLLHGMPATLADRRSPAVRRAVAGAAGTGTVVIYEHLRSLANRVGNDPYVLALQNLDSAQVELKGTLLRSTSSRLERLLTRWVERRVARDPRALVLAVSEGDALAMGPHAVVVPNGTDLPDEVPPPSPAGTTLFLSSLTYAPNREAVAWWAGQVWPHCSGTPPLTVAGLGGAGALGELARHPGLDVIGPVEDVGTVLREACVVAVPLVSGGGTRLKVLEAWAWGRPVVTTSKGVEGLPARDGVEALIADDPRAFAHAVQRVRTDPELAAGLVASGRRAVEGFGWPRIGERFASAVLAHRG